MKKLIGYASLIIGVISFAVFLKLALPESAREAIKEFLKVSAMLSVESFKILAELASVAWKFLSLFLTQIHALWEQVNIPALSGNGWAMIWALATSFAGFLVYRFCR